MDKKVITGGVLAGLVAAAAMASVVSAQSVADPVDITQEQAVALALGEVEGTVEEVELDKEDGKSVYEIEILGADGKEYEIEIDANTGDVLEVEIEEDDKDDKDDDDD